MEPLDDEDMTLTDRERKIARLAAKIAVHEIITEKVAVREVTDELYRSVGKSVLTRLLVWIGAAVVGYAVAHGWIK